MKKGKYIIISGLIILFLSVVGLSYAYWMQSETQKDFNEIGSKCFELTMIEETDGIILDKVHPVTDEDGMKEEGYTFTIRNTCNTLAYYQVNLEEMGLANEEKVLSEDYIKLSLNDSNGRKITEYETVRETINDAIDAHKLTSGSLEPDGEATYTLKLWMDYDTPAIEDVMDATYESKISVIASEIEEEKLENTIEVTSESENETYSKDKETIQINGKSTNYDITEYSFDNEVFNALKPNKNVTIEKEESIEGTYPVYFKDEVGNIQEGSYETSKLDQTGPEIEVQEESDDEGALLTITFKDLKSGLKEYRVKDGVSTIDLEEEQWEGLEGSTQKVTYHSVENKKIVIESKDQLENLKEVEFEITKADIEGPNITVTNPSEGKWTKDDLTITINATDEISGVNKFYYKKQNDEVWTEIETSNVTITGKNGSATVKFDTNTDATYEFKAKDKQGNESTSQTTIVKVDKTTPSITVSNSKNNTWTKENVTVTITTTDTFGEIDKSYYRVQNTGDWTEIKNGSVTFSSNTNATYEFKTVDQASNESTSVTTIVKVDKTTPSITVNNSKNNAWTKDNLTVTVTPKDDFGAISKSYYRVQNTGSWLEITNGSVTFSSSTNATYEFKTVDQASNESNPVTTIVKVDKGVPTQSFPEESKTDGSNGWKKAIKIKVTGSDTGGSNISGGKYCTGTSECTPGTTFTGSTASVTLGDGDGMRVCATFTDNAGNTSTKTCSSTYKVDGTNPTITGVSVSLGTNETSIVATINGASDSTSKVKTYTFKLSNGTTQTSTTNSTTFTNLNRGTSYTVTGSVTDNAGNTSNSTTSGGLLIPYPTLIEYIKNTVPKVTSGNGLYNDTPTLSGWTTTEYRYAGASPSNYVTFNGETWRIIGLVNVKTTSGKIEQRVKIIREESIGNYSWDSSSSKVNWGDGVNEWSQADIMKLLNPGYETNQDLDKSGTTITLNNSLYWKGESGKCHKGASNNTFDCDFSGKGLSKSESYIADDIIWNTGSNGNNDYQTGLPKHFYEWERSSNNGKICSSGSRCNDEVSRTIEWKSNGNKKALVGLMYPSDYGYATNGETDRNSCLNSAIYSWNTNCINNNWISSSSTILWTMTPYADFYNKSAAGYAFYVSRKVGNNLAGNSFDVRPVVYLKSNVRVTGGNGSSGSHFTLSL